MGKLALLVALLVIGCTTIDPSPPQVRLSPRASFIILGHKDAELEVHLRVVYMTQHEDCLEQRPLLGGNVVRLHRDGMLSYAAGAQTFTAEFFLDRYEKGRCQWRPRDIEVSVNRPPYNAARAAWRSMVWAEGVLGTDLEEAHYHCSPSRPAAKALDCDGPLVAIAQIPGQLRAFFTQTLPGPVP